MAPAGKVSGLPGKAQGAFRRRLTSQRLSSKSSLDTESTEKVTERTERSSIPTLRACLAVYAPKRACIGRFGDLLCALSVKKQVKTRLRTHGIAIPMGEKLSAER